MTSPQLALERAEKEKILLSQFSEKTAKAFLDSIEESRHLHKDAEDIKSFLSNCFNGLETSHNQKYSADLVSYKDKVFEIIEEFIKSDDSEIAREKFMSTWVVLGKDLQKLLQIALAQSS